MFFIFGFLSNFRKYVKIKAIPCIATPAGIPADSGGLASQPVPDQPQCETTG